ncbi:hypothetical protein PEL8287_02967 [Roseovarius litorisediminis]|uniref:Extensin-like C-terminal domain-containing protein n=1 Tax=Roseovarius litorisediminis TaxID=1312363 RepID=A0A1Y5T9I5_9RHOB|nr:extensin family protein [Roseovarius litorisediminis]SLN55396.1 hypothetical protein PEL8287_02967 [Roseovarius litorisediminis]
MKRIVLLAMVILTGCSFGGGRNDKEVVSTRGSVCGMSEIKGEAIGRVSGRIPACGIGEAVRITSINGVELSQQATMECGTARTLKKWMERSMTPAIGRTGGGVAGLRVASHYACRTRNSQSGARISEHAKGRAIDIAAFKLRDGSEISVLEDWGSGKKGRILKKLHKSACGPFGTVLGPNSDRHHRDHFHFDTASYRNGAYCR